MDSEARQRRELVEHGGFVIERFAVQHLVLLHLSFLLPAFGEQHSAHFLVDVPIKEAR